MKRILLHICCAPCAIFPLELLQKEGYEAKGFFFNPNIHPLSEYERRLKTLEIYAKNTKLEFERGLYEPKIFFRAIYQKEEAPLRCHICWRLRLKITAINAKEQGCEYFTTTLLGSPYQDTKILETIGEEEAKDSGVKFLKANFKSGFRPAHNQAKQRGLYCQKYCGCIYSEIERYHKKSKIPAWPAGRQNPKSKTDSVSLSAGR